MTNATTQIDEPSEPAWQLSSDAVVARSRSNAESGLDSAEVRTRQEQSGPNELRETELESRWQRFVGQFQDPLVSLLLVAILISGGAWLLEGARGLPVDAIVIAVIVIANAILGFVQENKAADAVAALAEMTKANSTVLREGRKVVVPSIELVPGDILLLEEGDAVGADARLIEATSLRIQEASLTGESAAVTKHTEAIEGLPSLGDRMNSVFKGTAVVQGVGKAVVIGIGMNTEIGAIANLLDSTKQQDSPLKREISRISKWLGVIVIGIAVLVMAVLGVISAMQGGGDFVQILILGVSLAVAAVPEGLPAILSLVLALGVQALAKRNAVMKDLPSVETLGAASVICSDKTGTLTRNEMTVVEVVTASGTSRLSGIGYEPSGGIAETTNESAAAEARETVFAGAVANNAQLDREESGWAIVGDPTEVAFIVAWPKLSDSALEPSAGKRLGEVPFNSERKLMSVLVAGWIYSKGAPDILLSHCEHELVGSELRPLTPPRREEILANVVALSATGMRTLGTARRAVSQDAISEEDERDLTFCGFVGIIDPPREEAKDAIAEAHDAGIRTVMITGDHPVTAASIASQLGIIEPGARVLTGQELDALDNEEFAAAAKTVDVYARVAPEHKLKLVNAMRDAGEIVAMTGDGVNDAPALKAADIGVAMGITGTEVTKEAGRMILADDNYATIVTAVRQGRIVFNNIQKFLRYLLSSNMGEVCTVFFGVVLAGVIGLTQPGGGVALPLLATQVLWINLVTDTGPALAMGIDPASPGVMKRPPRGLGDHVIDRHMWGRVIYIGIIMGAVTLLTIDLFLPGGLIEGNDSLEVARTAGFTTLVLAQLFNAFNSRSDDRSAFSQLFTNGWLWGAIALAALLQVAVVHVPFLQTAFGTAPLDLEQWLVTIGMASVVLWAEELMKLVRRILEI